MNEALRIEREREAARKYLPMSIDPQQAHQAIAEVGHWYHTFALNVDEGIYTPGTSAYNVEQDYRLAALPTDLSGKSVLDLCAYDGFYSFVCAERGASEVVALDNQQLSFGQQTMMGSDHGQGLLTIRRLLNSPVAYLHLQQDDLSQLARRFDLILCYGILHWLDDPLSELQKLNQLLSADGTVLVELLGYSNENSGSRVIHATDPYQHQHRWVFSSEGLRNLALRAGYQKLEVVDTRVIDDQPRMLARLIGQDAYALTKQEQVS